MGLNEHAEPKQRKEWYEKYKGTSHDLPLFYETIIKSIREIDSNVPIMLDGGWYANAWSFNYWPSKLKDDKILYSFHMYEPYIATSSPNIKREIKHPYPGVKTMLGEQEYEWNKSTIDFFLNEPFKWAKANGIAPNRMVASEFGCVRVWNDCGKYLNDVLDNLNKNGAHWAFYSFREDVWEAMDYEIPPTYPAGSFYYKTEQGKANEIPRSPSPLMNIIKNKMIKPK